MGARGGGGGGEVVALTPVTPSLVDDGLLLLVVLATAVVTMTSLAGPAKPSLQLSSAVSSSLNFAESGPMI